jgi:hypothetical protein
MSFFDFLFCLLRTIKLSTDMPDSRRLSSVFFTVFCTILFYVTLLHSILFYPFINHILYCAVLFALRTAYEYNEQESHHKIIKKKFAYFIWCGNFLVIVWFLRSLLLLLLLLNSMVYKAFSDHRFFFSFLIFPFLFVYCYV